MNAYVNLDTGKVLRIYLLVTVNYFCQFSRKCTEEYILLEMTIPFKTPRIVLGYMFYK